MFNPGAFPICCCPHRGLCYTWYLELSSEALVTSGLLWYVVVALIQQPNVQCQSKVTRLRAKENWNHADRRINNQLKASLEGKVMSVFLN